jgi:hypothetical protein
MHQTRATELGRFRHGSSQEIVILKYQNWRKCLIKCLNCAAISIHAILNQPDDKSQEDYRGSSARPLAHDAHDVQDLATGYQAVSGETNA